MRVFLKEYRTKLVIFQQAITDRLERDVSVLQETVSLLKEELRSKESLIDDLHRQCESYESKFDVIQNVRKLSFLIVN